MYELDTDTIEAHGLTFRVSIKQDCDSSRPWEECDSYGIVREARSSYGDISKAPGERILHKGERNCYSWVYDWAGTMKHATKEGWGIGTDRPANWDSLTTGQKTELAVQRDFDFLKAWCEGEWVWCGVCVDLMVEDEDGDLVEYAGPLNCSESLWSIEYWQYEGVDGKRNAYIKEVIAEMTQTISETYKAEAAERQACAERDIMTEAA